MSGTGTSTLPVRLALVLGGLLACCLPALVNGFPLVYSDTGTYIHTAITGEMPIDRPYWYGGLIAASLALGTGLWGVVMLQAALLSIQVHRLVWTLVPPARTVRYNVLAILLLAAGTSAAWYAGQLMPDVFTSIGLLAVFLLLRGRSGLAGHLLDLAVIMLACWTHLSNLVILPLAGLGLILLGPSPRIHVRQDLTRLALLCLLSWGGLAAANHGRTGETFISKGGHVFLMGRMIDAGMLKPFLDEHCPTAHYRLCAYKDSLPTRAQEFLWWGNSPLAREGGWDATRPEYDAIIRASLTEPRYLLRHITSSLAATADQLTLWRISGDLVSHWFRTPESAPYGALAKHMPATLPAFLGSLQNGGRGELSMVWPDRAYRLTLFLSLLALPVLLRRRGRWTTDPLARIFLWYALCMIVVAAWTCATLSTVDTRYLGRSSWILPLAVLLASAWLRPVSAPPVPSGPGDAAS